jgi:Xaa-Pro aminopeptidase
MPSIARGRERIGRAQALMAQQGIDALFLATGRNLLFLSGYPTLELTLARPFYLVVPAREAPVLLVHEGRAAEARRYSWIRDVRTYRMLSVAPVAELRRIADERGLLTRRGRAASRIGAELGREQRLGIPVLELDRVRMALAPARIEDAADLLWTLRMTKSPGDLASLRRASRITAAAYATTFRAARPGDQDRLVARRMTSAMADLGGQEPWVLVASGVGNYALATGAPLDRALLPGDMLWFDSGCAVDGFWSDFSRAGVVGRPSADQRDAQRRIVELTARGVGMVRPGVPIAEIASVVDEGVRTIGLPVDVATSDLAARVGHGVGFDVTEPPHVAAADPTILAPGMVITIEPGVAASFGLFHCEEVVAVTATGHEVLSRSPRHLRSIGTS